MYDACSEVVFVYHSDRDFENSNTQISEGEENAELHSCPMADFYQQSTSIESDYYNWNGKK